MPKTTEGGIRADLARYANGVDEEGAAATPLPVEARPNRGAPVLAEISSILRGLFNTRSSRGVLVAKRISSLEGVGLITTVAQGTRTTFNLGRFDRRGTAMSWSLSLGSRDTMDALLDPNGGWLTDLSAYRKERATEFLKTGRVLLDCQRMAADQLATMAGAPVRPSIPTCDNPFAGYIGVRLARSPVTVSGAAPLPQAAPR